MYVLSWQLTCTGCHFFKSLFMRYFCMSFLKLCEYVKNAVSIVTFIWYSNLSLFGFYVLKISREFPGLMSGTTGSKINKFLLSPIIKTILFIYVLDDTTKLFIRNLLSMILLLKNFKNIFLLCYLERTINTNCTTKITSYICSHILLIGKLQKNIIYYYIRL